jgi:transcription initiation factor TFIIE subunit beta
MPASLHGSGVPSPSPSNASTSTGQKRKRPAGTVLNAVQAEQAKTHTPTEFLTQLTLTETYLRDSGKEVTFTELIKFLSLQHGAPEHLNVLRQLLQRSGPSDKVAYNPKAANGQGTFKYRSILPVENAEDLKGFLQRRAHSVGVKVDELKDGWKNVLPEVGRMEGNGELLVVRDKNARPKTVWQNDKTMMKRVDPDLQKQWHSIKIPVDTEDLRNKLISAGLTPTSAPRRIVAAKVQDKKRKVSRRGGRQTNVHMQNILKDYSNRNR